MKDICDRVVKELETLGVSESFNSKMSDDLQVTNEAKEYDSRRLNESNEMASDAGPTNILIKGSKKKKKRKPLEA
ncbi:hypothetical protein HN51_045148 [Arachis hypogaea]|nr:E3 UFM1-protein ligase-like protein [Arachis hypogaea]